MRLQLTKAASRLAIPIALGLALVPVFMYIWFIHAYAVNAPYWDDWLQIQSLRYLHDGTLNWSFIYGGDNAQRALLPRLVGLGIAKLTGFNVKALIYCGAACLIGAYGILVMLLRRYRVSWMAIVPVGFFLFSLARYEDAMWASDFAWDLVLLFLVGIVALLDLRRSVTFACAVAASVAVSLSSFQGLFVWPAGLLYLRLTGSRVRETVIWLLVAAGTAVAYFNHLNVAYSDPLHNVTHTGSFSISHSYDELIFALASLGNTYIVATPPHVQPVWLLVALGAAIALLSAAALLIVIAEKGRDGLDAILAALIVFNACFILSIAYGRSWSGLTGATVSRYTIYSLLMLAAVYVVFARRAIAAGASAGRIVTFIVVLCFLLPQVVVSALIGQSRGSTLWHERMFAGMVAQNYGTASDELIQRGVYWNAPALRHDLAPYAAANRLGVFGWSSHYLDKFWCQSAGRPVTGNADHLAADSPHGLSPDAWLDIVALHGGVHQRTELSTHDKLGLLSWAMGEMSIGSESSLCLYPYGREIRSEYLLAADRWLSARGALSRRVRARTTVEILPGQSYRVSNASNVRPHLTCASLFLYPRPVRSYGCRADSAHGVVFTVPAEATGLSIASCNRCLIAELPLQLPPKAARLSRKEPSLAGAWLELTRAYKTDPNLRIEIPQQLPNFDADLVEWGLRSAIDPRSGAAALAPYANDLRRLQTVTTAGVPNTAQSGIWVFDLRSRPGWYLPEGFNFPPTHDDALLFWGLGEPQALYAHSPSIRVRPGERVQISATIDARAAVGGAPCFYLAALPSGAGLGMTCISAGKIAHLANHVVIPPGVTQAAFVAFTNNAVVPRNALIVYSGARIAQ